MIGYKSKEMIAAYENGGYRERYTMENGRKSIIYVNGHKCFKFTYSKWKDFQDGNGAIFDTVTENWID